MYKSDGSYKGWCKNTSEIPTFFNELNKSLFDSIVSTVKKTDGW
jgi:hypothetical protein